MAHAGEEALSSHRQQLVHQIQCSSVHHQVSKHVKNKNQYESGSFLQFIRTLAEVGKLETPKIQGKYETGQLFLHRVFGYRGVVLFPWVKSFNQHLHLFILIHLSIFQSARVYDRDILADKKNAKYLIHFITLYISI